MRKLLLALFSSLFTSAATASDFEVGQVWKYKTRDHEKNSTLTVLQIDHLNGMDIIHIRLDNVHIEAPFHANGYISFVPHLPINKPVLQSSVIEQIDTNEPLPNYSDGYRLWREAYDKGEGGVFTISVSECVSVIEQGLNQ